MDRTVGTCSECGGRVTLPEAWMSTKPPIPSCEKCGATQAQPYGPVVKMRPAKPRDPGKNPRPFGYPGMFS